MLDEARQVLWPFRSGPVIPTIAIGHLYKFEQEIKLWLQQGKLPLDVWDGLNEQADGLEGPRKLGWLLGGEWERRRELVPARLMMTLLTLCSPVASVHEKFVLHRAGTIA